MSDGLRKQRRSSGYTDRPGIAGVYRAWLWAWVAQASINVRRASLPLRRCPGRTCIIFNFLSAGAGLLLRALLSGGHCMISIYDN
eukprot:scaffold102368_cov34-Prasinocladus_malaysianus.AAC.1